MRGPLSDALLRVKELSTLAASLSDAMVKVEILNYHCLDPVQNGLMHREINAYT